MPTPTKGDINTKKNFRPESIAAGLALAMLIIWMFIGNIKYSLLDEVGWLCIGENFVHDCFGGSADTGDAYFINVGYDKQVVDVQVSPLDSGRAVITDRKLLLNFLNIAERADYKYLFLDIRFEKGYDTACDSVLFAKIAGMRDIVIAHHYEPVRDQQGNWYNNFEIADSVLLSKTAYNDYYTSALSSGFTRYSYLQDGRTSVALRMYQDIDGKTIRHLGWYYWNEGAFLPPCENSPYIPIKGGVGPVTTDSVSTTAQYKNLGPFLMALPEEVLIEEMKGKIVIVGDFEEDVHDTYMSTQPGSYLTYLAYKYLASGGNKIPLHVIILLAVGFFFIIRGILLKEQIFPWGHHPLLRFVTAVMWAILPALVCTLVYLTTGYTFNVLIPSLVISLVIIVMDSKRPEEEKNKEEKPSEKTAAK